MTGINFVPNFKTTNVYITHMEKRKVRNVRLKGRKDNQKGHANKNRTSTANCLSSFSLLL